MNSDGNTTILERAMQAITIDTKIISPEAESFLREEIERCLFNGVCPERLGIITKAQCLQEQGQIESKIRPEFPPCRDCWLEPYKQ